MKNKIH